jgi:hypothetical protein
LKDEVGLGWGRLGYVFIIQNLQNTHVELCVLRHKAPTCSPVVTFIVTDIVVTVIFNTRSLKINSIDWYIYAIYFNII